MNIKSAPAAPQPSRFEAKHYEDLLVAFLPHTLNEAAQTVHGPTDVVVADVTVCSGPAAGVALEGALIFQKGLVSQLRDEVGTGNVVAGTLSKVNVGGFWRWEIAELTDDQAKSVAVALGLASA